MRIVNYLIPTREQVANLAVGDTAIDCFGDRTIVTEITARKDDVKGKLFVCYYTKTGAHESSQTSMSMKEGELCRTVALSCRHTSAELDRIEQLMLDTDICCPYHATRTTAKADGSSCGGWAEQLGAGGVK